MRNSLETRIGIFVAVVVLAAVFILDIVGGGGKLTRGYKLHALFSNVQDLKIGDRVKMAGVEVGRVQDIQLTNNKVLVMMKVRPNAQVKTDSIATIKFTGLLGQNFVSVGFGTPQGEAMKDNQFIATEEQADLGAMMQKLDKVAEGVENVTKSFTGFKIDTLVGPLRDFHKRQQGPPDRHDFQHAGVLGRYLFPDFARQRHAGQTHQG